MIELLKKIYDRYGFDNYVAMPYFNKFVNELINYDFAEILAYQAKEYPLSYVVEFLLSTPSLWTQMLEPEWIEVMALINPRPDPWKMIDFDDAHFVDIHFLCKYVEVNPIELFLGQARFSDTDKKNVLRYCRRDAELLIPDLLDLEEMNGEYFISKDEMKKVKSRLVSGQMLYEFNYTAPEFIRYIEELQKVYC